MFEPKAYDNARAHTGPTLLFIRHGQTLWNATGRHLGWSDIGLDEQGKAQARALSEHLDGRFDRVVSSPLSRALDTARALDPKPGEDRALMELNQGDLEGLEPREGIAKWPSFYADFQRDPTDIRPPGSIESLGECRDRMLACIDGLSEGAQPGEIIAIVSHQMAMASVLCTLAGLPLRSWRKFCLPNCGLRIVQRVGSSYRIV